MLLYIVRFYSKEFTVDCCIFLCKDSICQTIHDATSHRAKDKYVLQLVCEQIYINWFLDCLDKHEKPGSCWFYVALMNIYCGIN
jgi:hypothetical protein